MPRLQKLIPLLLISHVLAYGDISSIWLNAKETKLVQFLTHNLQLSLLDYSGSVGAADFFWLDDKHHHWKQLGFSDSDLSPTLGLGAGYRYVFKEIGFKSDWFLGVYIQGRLNIQAPFENGSWIAAGEFATQNFQWTLSRYATIKQPNSVTQDQMNSVGYSLRLSSYYFDYTNTFWKIYPFVFIARTHLQDCDRKEPIVNGGCGARVAFPYVTLETKVIWDQVKPAQFLGLRYQIGIQVNLNETADGEKGSVKKRARARPEAYEVSYSRQNILSHEWRESEKRLTTLMGSLENLGALKPESSEYRDNLNAYLSIMSIEGGEERTAEKEQACIRLVSAMSKRFSLCQTERAYEGFLRSNELNERFLDALSYIAMKSVVIEKEEENINKIYEDENTRNAEIVLQIIDKNLEGVDILINHLEATQKLNNFLKLVKDLNEARRPISLQFE